MFIFVKKYVRFWEGLMQLAGAETDPYKYCGYLAGISVALGAVAAIVLRDAPIIRLALGAFTIIVVHAVAYANLVLTSNSRAAKVEEVLPDFLSLVSSNIRAGLTSDRALIISARDEFGPLTEAIRKAGKNSITGMPLEQVLLQMGEYINSNTLRKTFGLIVEGMQSGGDMAELLEKTALDLRKFRSVRREIGSIILNYELFIIAAISLGAPMLYGVSTFLVDIMLKIKSKIAASSGGDSASAMSTQVGIFKGKLLLTPEAISFFAMSSIVITVFFGCMAVGVMGSGRRVEGLKYFPVLALLGIGILLGVRAGLSAVLTGMMGT
jgi:pilus assembly protein TadC